MGVDLRLLPIDCLHSNPNGELWGFSHTVLTLPRRHDAWPEFDALHPDEIPETADISSFVTARIPDGTAAGETMYGKIGPTDAFGNRYTWLEALSIKPLLAEWFSGHPVTAYISALPDDTRIVLDWH